MKSQENACIFICLLNDSLSKYIYIFLKYVVIIKETLNEGGRA